MTLPTLARRLSKLATDNSPVILTAIGVTGVLSTAYLAARASFKSARMIDEHYEVMLDGDKLPIKKSVELCWKNYVPAATSATITIAAVICANRVEARRAAALAAVYTISERAFDEYKSKVVEKLGARKEQGIRDEIAQDQVTRNPVNNCEVIIAGTGEQLCYDTFSGRYFSSDMETLRKAQNDLNQQIINDSYASLSDFYYHVGLKATKTSSEIGWTTDKLMELRFSTVLSDDGRPCISVDFSVAPIRGYDIFS